MKKTEESQQVLMKELENHKNQVQPQFIASRIKIHNFYVPKMIFIRAACYSYRFTDQLFYFQTEDKEGFATSCFTYKRKNQHIYVTPIYKKFVSDSF